MVTLSEAGESNERSEDISEDVLPKLYKSIMHEPEFTVTIDGGGPLETIGKS